ncbi:hypothetical protein [Croceicoccus sp. Ery15]|uniref:hypothetical protein n=1 Tax=Croceicoccus sp. Ery15 TaxID=1703338 RepID=UPI001E3A96D0|nr:hypothetical protein [Croceicoccus sp. Ery15]
MTARGLLIWQCLGHIVPVMRTILAAAALVIWPGFVPNVLAKEPPEEVIFEPSTDWLVDFAENRCLLTRLFKSGEREFRLQFVQYQPGDAIHLLMASEKKFGRSKFRARVGTSTDFREYESYHTLDWDSVPAAFVSLSLRPRLPDVNDENARPIWTDREREELTAAMERLEVEIRGERLVVKTGSLRAPMSVMDRCTDNLVESWGIDIAAHANLTRRAAPVDYRDMFDKMIDAPQFRSKHAPDNLIAVVRVDLDEAGLPTGCHTYDDMSYDKLDEFVCEVLMEDTKFLPALDSEGNPIASYYMTSFGLLRFSYSWGSSF